MTENRNRELRIYTRLTPEEMEILEQKMAQADITNREYYLRLVALQGYVLSCEPFEAKEISFLLRNATNNINQIARRVNQGGRVYESELKEIQANQEKLWDTFCAILEEMKQLKLNRRN